MGLPFSRRSLGGLAPLARRFPSSPSSSSSSSLLPSPPSSRLLLLLYKEGHRRHDTVPRRQGKARQAGTTLGLVRSQSVGGDDFQLPPKDVFSTLTACKPVVLHTEGESPSSRPVSIKTTTAPKVSTRACLLVFKVKGTRGRSSGRSLFLGKPKSARSEGVGGHGKGVEGLRRGADDVCVTPSQRSQVSCSVSVPNFTVRLLLLSRRSDLDD